MYDKYNVDKEKRQTLKLEHSNRETPVKRADGEVIHILNHRTAIKLERIYPEEIDTIMEVLTKKMQIEPPTFEKIQYRLPDKGVL